MSRRVIGRGRETFGRKGGVYEVDKNSGGTVTATRSYYPAAGAMRVNSAIYFIRADHLGSASAVTDVSGNVAGRQLYYPYGQTRQVSGAMYTDRLFTGQREMAGLGIYHYNARFYSPVNNHFISADTIVPGYGNPQSLNRYSYAFNNPIRYNDPDGHCPVCALPLVVIDVALVAAAATAVYVAINPDARDAMTESITNALDNVSEMAKGRQGYQQNKKQLESLETSSYGSGGNYLGPGYSHKPKQPKCGFWCKMIGVGAAGGAACASMFEDECVNSVSKPKPVPNPEPTSAPTLTLTPTLTSSVTATLTSTPTSTLTSTPTISVTSTSTRIPFPTSVQLPRRFGGHYED